MNTAQSNLDLAAEAYQLREDGESVNSIAVIMGRSIGNVKYLLSDRFQAIQGIIDTNPYLPWVEDILKQNAMHIMSVAIADKEKDMKHATDMIISVTGGDVAVRIRKYRYYDKRFRDFTIRSRSRGGGNTELDKLRAGFGDWYVYAWLNAARSSFVGWMLLDIEKMRKSGMLARDMKEIPNRDGTRFVNFSICDLRLAQCITNQYNI
jgi:hypothetical protein